jgi:hypothetical protein
MKESGFSLHKMPTYVTRNGNKYELITAHFDRKRCNEQIKMLKDHWDKEFYHFTTKPVFFIDDRSTEYGVFLLYGYSKPHKVKNWK